MAAANVRDNVQAQNYDPSGCGLGSKYSHFEGLAVLPMATSNGGNSGPVEVVRIHAPVRTRIMDFRFVKTNTPPLIPSPSSTDMDYILSSDLNLPLPAATVGQSNYTWEASGTYVFIEQEAWSLDNGFRIGDYPFQTPNSQLYGIGGNGSGGPAIEGGSSITSGEELGDLATFVSTPITLRNFNFSAGDSYSDASVQTAVSYDNYVYDYQSHYPSNFLSEDMSIGS